MAIAPRGTPTSGSSVSSPIATTLPTGWQPGDYAKLTITSTDSGTTIEAPEGWTAHGPAVEGGGETSRCFFRFLKEGDAAPSITILSSDTGWSIDCWSGAESVESYVAAAFTVTAKAWKITGVKAEGAARRVVLAFTTDPPNAEPTWKVTVPTGTTERLNTDFSGVDNYIALADVEKGSGTYEFEWTTASATAMRAVLFAVVLKPKEEAAPTPHLLSATGVGS